MNQTIITQVSQVSLNQTIGLAFSRNNTVYQTYGKVVSVKGNTIKVQSEIAFRGYEAGQVFTYSFSKSTKTNHVFVVDSINLVTSFNEIVNLRDTTVQSIADSYIESKLEAADKEQKEQGVYKAGEVWVMDATGFHKSHDNFEVSE